MDIDEHNKQSKAWIWVGLGIFIAVLIIYIIYRRIKRPSEACEELDEKAPFLKMTNEAKALFKDGKFAEACRLYLKAQSLAFNDISLYNATSWTVICYIQLSNYDEALKHLNKAVEINPHDDFAYEWRSGCYEYFHNYKRALEDLMLFARFVKLNPRKPNNTSQIEKLNL